MRKIVVALGLAAAAVAMPAQANEGRAEVRGGIAWAGGSSEAIAGVAAGYDFDLSTAGGAFAGVEGSADKLLVGGADVIFGATGRIGTKLDNGKLYATGGYSFGDGDAWHVGAGYEHKVGTNVYLKAEYRRFLLSGTDINSAVAGIGIGF